MASKYPCLKCSQHIKKNIESVRCNICEQWVHKSCSDEITDELYKILKEQDKQGFLKWNCDACRNASQLLNQKIEALNAIVQQISGRVTEVEAGQVRQDSAISDLKRDNANIKADIITLKDGEATKDDIFREITERENRKENLLIHKLPESRADRPSDKKSDDQQSLNKVFSAMNCTVDIGKDVKFFYRAGERQEEGRSRPLVVGFRDPGLRDRVLNHARNLSSHPTLKDLNVVADLTARQRKEEEDMRKEADKRNQEMTREESGNFEWKVVGPRGKRKLVRSKRMDRPGWVRRRSDEEQGHSPPHSRMRH
jgi:hypothetical protein